MYMRLKQFPMYEINEFGVVRNFETKYVTTQRMNRSGYLFVQLIDKGKNHVCLVHRLVAETFLPNPNNLPIVNHIDECAVHNSVDNLEWVSYKDNSNHGTRNERIVRDRKIPIIAFDDNGNTIYRFPSRYDASRDLGVSEHSLRVAMKNHNKCRNLYWRIDDNPLDEDVQQKNKEWITQTIKDKETQNVNKMTKSPRSIIAKDRSGKTIFLFPTVASAAKFMGVSSTAISNAIKNNTKCKELKWDYDSSEGEHK